MPYVAVLRLDDLWSGEIRRIETTLEPASGACGADLSRIRGGLILVRQGEQISAFEDRCAHLGVRLSEHGHIEGSTLSCRVHGWQYDIRWGLGLNPCNVRLKQRPVKIEAGIIFVDLEVETCRMAIG
jgi:nitrite reductase/ring-hydroxylating ferredoxin subunit